MNRFLYLSLFIIIFSTKLTLNAAVLKWDIPVTQRLELVKTADVKYFVNSRIKRIFQERNIIDLTCYAKENNFSRVKGAFSVFRRESTENVFLLRKQHTTDFIIEKTGRMVVDKNYIMPNLRNIPTFPAADIKPGENWNAPGMLILNNFSIQLNLLLDVNYFFSAMEKIDGKNVARVNYHYLIDKDLSRKNVPGDLPQKIYGQNSGTVLWDVDNSRPFNIKDKYKIMFVFGHRRAGFNSVEFHMNIETKPKIYSVVSKKEKEKAKEELKKEFSDEDDIEVDTNKRGLVLRLGEILFDFNSHKLRTRSKNLLNKIIKIIKKKYPHREIIVEGHTDIIGPKNYNKKLSVSRARSVAEFLKLNGDHDKLSYRGFGPDKPIADNKTKKGRQKNRRVELIIKLN